MVLFLNASPLSPAVLDGLVSHDNRHSSPSDRYRDQVEFRDMAKHQVKVYRKKYLTSRKGNYLCKLFYLYLPKDLANPS